MSDRKRYAFVSDEAIEQIEAPLRDTIATLTAERDREKAAADYLRSQWDRTIEGRKSDVATLTAERDKAKAEAYSMRNAAVMADERREAAEARSARLEEALRKIEAEAGSHTVAVGQRTGFARIFDIARAARAALAQETQP